jgi:virulence-associated protein VapD
VAIDTLKERTVKFMTRVRPSENITYLIEIHFNEKKIVEDGEYSYEDVYNTVRDVFFEKGFGYICNETGSLFIYDRGDKTDYGVMWRTIFDLYETDWFKKFVDGYYYYDFDDEDNDGTCEADNMMDVFAKEGL